MKTLSGWRGSVVRRARWLIWCCALAALTGPASRMVSAESAPQVQWLLELAAHGQWAYAAAGAVAMVALLWLHPRRWLFWPVLVCVACVAWQSPTLPSASWANAQPPGPSLAVATANLQLSTQDFSRLLNWLASDDAPDVVFLQEFTEDAQRALASSPAVRARYPHHVAVPQPDPFGLAILSRYALTQAEAVQPQDAFGTLRLRAQLAWNDGTVRLVALHPMPPLNLDFARARDQALRDESQRISQQGGLGIVAGDFNLTPWSRGLFAVQDHLRRAAPGWPTWPNVGGWFSVLPLDHVLGTPGWTVQDAAWGPDLGSDHRPMVVRLVHTPPTVASVPTQARHPR